MLAVCLYSYLVKSVVFAMATWMGCRIISTRNADAYYQLHALMAGYFRDCKLNTRFS